MARDSELIKQRDEHIIQKFRQYTDDFPHWRTWFVIQKIAAEFYLSEITVEYILFKKYQDDEKITNG